MHAPETQVLGRLDPSARFPFDRHSAIRRVTSEPIMFATVQRALVMDVAHAKVGQGVADHSGFRRQPMTRLWSTTDAGMRLVFGDSEMAREAARHIYRIHDHINGSTADGQAYTAHDASLLLWVWATLVDSFDTGFTRWVRPYRPGEGDEFYADMVSFATFFGIPPGLIPPDRQSFAAYLDAQLDDPALGTSAASAEMAHDVLFFKHWNVPAAVVRPTRVLAILTLDQRLRDRLGLELDSRDRRLADRLDGLLKAHYDKLPAIRTQVPSTYLFFRRPTIGLGKRLRRLAT
jgi:uncharacterized protein (DUF2236 family)